MANIIKEQECIPVGCVPSAAIPVSPGGGCLSAEQTPPPGADIPPQQTPPWSRHPPGADNPPPPSRHPRSRHPSEQTPRPRADTPRSRVQAPPPPRGQTDACKNKTFATIAKDQCEWILRVCLHRLKANSKVVSHSPLLNVNKPCTLRKNKMHSYAPRDLNNKNMYSIHHLK